MWTGTRRAAPAGETETRLRDQQGATDDPIPGVGFAPSSLRRILILRLNHRLGNTLFLTPLVSALARYLPQCEIDMFLGTPEAASLFDHAPGIRRVLSLPRDPFLHSLALARALFALREREYDLVIDPIEHSSSNRLAARLVKARRRLSFDLAEPRSGRPGTTPLAHSEHEALKPLRLLGHLSPSMTVDPTAPAQLELVLTAAERRRGEQDLAQILADHGGREVGRPVIGFFTEARGDKALAPDWWREWSDAIRREDPSVRLVQLAPPEPGSLRLKGIPHIQTADLRRVASMLAGLDLFVSGDTGPMHLASAVRTPTIGLFSTTRPDQYGLLGARDLSLADDLMDPGRVAGTVLQHLASCCPPDPASTVTIPVGSRRTHGG